MAAKKSEDLTGSEKLANYNDPSVKSDPGLPVEGAGKEVGTASSEPVGGDSANAPTHPAPAAASAGSAPLAQGDEFPPESVLQYVERLHTNLKAAKTHARVKLETIERRIADSGGEPTKAMADAVAALKAEAGAE